MGNQVFYNLHMIMNEKKLKECLGEKIRYYRRKTNLTQEVLGEKLSRNQRQISLIENGTSFPAPEVLVKMTEVFKCSLKDLFDFEILENRQSIELELNKIIQTMPDEKLKILYSIGKNL